MTFHLTFSSSFAFLFCCWVEFKIIYAENSTLLCHLFSYQNLREIVYGLWFFEVWVRGAESCHQTFVWVTHKYSNTYQNIPDVNYICVYINWRLYHYKCMHTKLTKWCARSMVKQHIRIHHTDHLIETHICGQSYSDARYIPHLGCLLGTIRIW